MEREQREAYRQEMLVLMKKQKKPKGAGLTREGTQPSGQLPQPQAVPAAHKRYIEKPVQAAKRSPEKPPPQPTMGQARPEGIRCTAVQKILPVDVDGQTLQLDIGTYSSIQDVINAVKELHRSLLWSQVCMLCPGTWLALFARLHALYHGGNGRTITDVVSDVQSPVLVYTRETNVFNSILLSQKTPWKHFFENAKGIRCIRR